MEFGGRGRLPGWGLRAGRVCVCVFVRVRLFMCFSMYVHACVGMHVLCVRAYPYTRYGQESVDT